MHDWLVANVIFGHKARFCYISDIFMGFFPREMYCILSFVFYIKTCINTCGHYSSCVPDELLICCQFLCFFVLISMECENAHIMKWNLCTYSYCDGGLWIQADVPVSANNGLKKGFI